MRRHRDRRSLVVTLPQRARLGLWQQTSAELPRRQHCPMHANLANNLLWGEPLTAPLEDATTVEAILQAGVRSMENNSCWETLDD